MTTPVLITGWEHGVATLTANGGGLVNTINGSGMSVQGSIKRTGSYALKTVAASSYGWLTYTLSTPTHITVSVYVYFATLFSSSGAVIYPSITAGTTISVRYNQATGYFSLYNGSTYVDTNIAPTTGVWYLIQADWDCATGTTTAKLKVDGGGEYTHTVTQTATTFTNVNVGIGSTMTSGEVYHDDLVVSVTAGDYPVPGCEVVGLSPTSDGTHTNTANSIEFQDGTDIVAATTTAYTAVNSVPIGNFTTYIRQVLIGAYYAELKFTTDKTNILGAIALLAYRSSSTTADNGACYWIDEDAVTTTIWGNPTTRSDYSETSIFYKRAILPVTAGGWDAAAIIAGKIRCGNSSDITPNPYWVDLMIELAYQPVAAYVLRCSAGTFAETGSNSIMLWAHELWATAGSFSLTGNNTIGKRLFTLLTTAGSFALSGQNSILKWLHQLRTTVGTFAETGNNALLCYKQIAKNATGSFALTGNNAILKTLHLIKAATGTFAETGNNSIELWFHKMFTTAGSFALSGGNAILLWAHKILSAAGSFILIGYDAILTYTPVSGVYNLLCATGLFIETAYDGILKWAHQVRTTTGTFDFTGSDAKLFNNRKIFSTSGVFNLTGNNAYMLDRRKVFAATGTFALTGNNAYLLRLRQIKAAAGDFALTGQNAILLDRRKMLVETGIFTFTGFDAILIKIVFGLIVLKVATGTFIVSPGDALLILHPYVVFAPGDDYGNLFASRKVVKPPVLVDIIPGLGDDYGRR